MYKQLTQFKPLLNDIDEPNLIIQVLSSCSWAFYLIQVIRSDFRLALPCSTGFETAPPWFSAECNLYVPVCSFVVDANAFWNIQNGSVQFTRWHAWEAASKARWFLQKYKLFLWDEMTISFQIYYSGRTI